jgi:hypothetical protein
VKLDKSLPITVSNRVSPWEIEPERRSVHILDPGMKRTRSQRGLQKEEQRKMAAGSMSDGSLCLDSKSRLTNAKKSSPAIPQ